MFGVFWFVGPEVEVRVPERLACACHGIVESGQKAVGTCGP